MIISSQLGLGANISLLGHFNLRGLLSMGKGEYTILALLLITLLVGLLADEFGFHPAVGAYTKSIKPRPLGLSQWSLLYTQWYYIGFIVF